MLFSARNEVNCHKYRTSVHNPGANMTSTSGLIFMMADIFRGGERKKTGEEIETEKKGTGTVTGLFINTVIALAERYGEEYNRNPEKYGIDRLTSIPGQVLYREKGGTRMESKAKAKAKAKTKTKTITNLFERLRTFAKRIWQKILYAVSLACRLISDVRGECRIPDEVIRDLARIFLPAILKMYEMEEGRAKLTALAEESKKRNAVKRQEATHGGKE